MSAPNNEHDAWLRGHADGTAGKKSRVYHQLPVYRYDYRNGFRDGCALRRRRTASGEVCSSFSRQMEKTETFVELYSRYKRESDGIKSVIDDMVDVLSESGLSDDERQGAMATICEALFPTGEFR